MALIRTQAELDAALAAGKSATCGGDGSFHVGGSARVRAWGSATVHARDSATVHAGGSSAVYRHSGGATIVGGVEIDARPPMSAEAWCARYLVEHNGNAPVLYKAVDDNWCSPHGVSYAPGTMPQAEDWDGGKAECGGGLHFSPTPAMALSFFCDATRFVAAPVDLCAAAFHPNAQYPEKVKVPGVAGPCYEVDIDGKPIVASTNDHTRSPRPAAENAAKE